MNKSLILFVTLSVFSLSLCQLAKNNKAVVIVPVADFSGTPLARYASHPLARHYENFSFAPDKGFFGCLRMHQAKYNEIVLIKSSEKGDEEVECEVFNLFYIDGKQIKRSNFWMLKKNLMPLGKLSKKIDIGVIPPPITMNQKPQEYNRNVLTLALPWYDTTTNKHYAAGTRFMRCKTFDSQLSYAVYCIDYEHANVEIGYVSKGRAVVQYPKTPEKAIELFLKLLRSWADENKGCVPYVYGGCSFTSRNTAGDYSLMRGKRCGSLVTFWERKSMREKPRAGFDCSGMILTAAQIAGMPYFLKNTYTISKRYLRPLSVGEKLENGDLLWYSGHIIVVSDVQRNLLIESVGYEPGYGKVHQVPVSKVFKGIKDYASLIHAYHKQRYFQRLTKAGKVFKRIYRINVFKIKSLWD